MGPRISALISTYNEADNLPTAMASLTPWVDEIVVVDSESTDGTAALAERLGARVFPFPYTGTGDAARTLGVEKCTGDWILVLDADELVTTPLAARLRQIAEADEVDVVGIPRINYMLGAPVLHTGWGPEHETIQRFFRKGKLTPSPRIHQCLVPAADAREMRLPHEGEARLIHFNYLDATQFLEKLNRYTTQEARLAFEEGQRVTPLRSLRRMLYEFRMRYFKVKGYKDGWRGFYLSLMMAFYRLATDVKLRELHEVGDREAVRRRYKEEADRFLSHSETREP